MNQDNSSDDCLSDSNNDNVNLVNKIIKVNLPLSFDMYNMLTQCHIDSDYKKYEKKIKPYESLIKPTDYLWILPDGSSIIRDYDDALVTKPNKPSHKLKLTEEQQLDLVIDNGDKNYLLAIGNRTTFHELIFLIGYKLSEIKTKYGTKLLDEFKDSCWAVNGTLRKYRGVWFYDHDS